jgi:hypothetical protein
VRDAFSLSSTSWASVVQEKRSCFLRSREMKRLKAAKHPNTLWTPLRSRIRPIRSRAATFSGLASMPRWETMYPKSMPRGTPKTHFYGFNFTPLARRQPNAMRRSLTRSSAFLVFTTMSSTYASTVHPMWSPKTCCMHRWYVAPAFRRPNDIVM